MAQIVKPEVNQKAGFGSQVCLSAFALIDLPCACYGALEGSSYRVFSDGEVLPRANAL